MTASLEQELLNTRADSPLTKKVPLLPGTVVYGYYLSTDRYESGFHLVSLHQTKAGAWRAKQKRQWALELEAVEQRLYPRSAFDTKDEDWRRVDSEVAHMIKAIVISP